MGERARRLEGRTSYVVAAIVAVVVLLALLWLVPVGFL